MAEVTVKQFAEVVGTSVERLLEQLTEAGVPKKDADATISDSEKMELLNFLRHKHGADDAASPLKEPKKITLKRKTTSELRQTGTHGKGKAVSVEVRKKRTYVKRSVVQEEENLRLEEERAKREELEAVKREQEELAKRNLEEQEAKRKAEEEAREKAKEEAELRRKEEEARQQAEEARKQQELQKAATEPDTRKGIKVKNPRVLWRNARHAMGVKNCTLKPTNQANAARNPKAALSRPVLTWSMVLPSRRHRLSMKSVCPKPLPLPTWHRKCPSRRPK
jgi:translation initiation factor IF-2